MHMLCITRTLGAGRSACTTTEHLAMVAKVLEASWANCHMSPRALVCPSCRCSHADPILPQLLSIVEDALILLYPATLNASTALARTAGTGPDCLPGQHCTAYSQGCQSRSGIRRSLQRRTYYKALYIQRPTFTLRIFPPGCCNARETFHSFSNQKTFQTHGRAWTA